jgi:hypothetical protein
MDWKTFATLTVSVVLAFVGYWATYWNNLRISQRKDKLDRVNRQLKELYGPLFALGHASEVAWKKFRGRYRPDGAFWGGPDDQPTKEEAVAWRLWMTEVFIPIIFKMEELILANSDLIDEPEMPAPFIALCAHIAGYKVVTKKWAGGDFTENTSSLNFPTELQGYVECEYKRLKAEQARLIALTTQNHA